MMMMSRTLMRRDVNYEVSNNEDHYYLDFEPHDNDDDCDDDNDEQDPDGLLLI